jgi:hypothetical protein
MICKTSNHDLAIEASPIRKISPTQQAINTDKTLETQPKPRQQLRYRPVTIAPYALAKGRGPIEPLGICIEPC